MNASSSGSPQSGRVSSMSLPKVLHYLQSEWRKFELERDSWSIERAELQNKVAVLEGERRGLENVKTDLLKRIKLLEYALRQERLKYLRQSVTDDSNRSQFSSSLNDIPPDGSSDNTVLTSIPSSLPMHRDRGGVLFRPRRDSMRSREILKAYLKEINTLCSTKEHYNENAREVTAHETSEPNPSTGISFEVGMDRCSLDLLEDELPIENQSTHSLNVAVSVPDHQTILNSTNSSSDHSSFVNFDQRPPTKRNKREIVSRIDNLSIKVSEPDHQPHSPRTWRMKHTLRHHVDVIRMVDIHATDSILASASEDYTVKLWQLGQKRRDIEPFLTLRAHRAPVLAVAFSAHNDLLFSAGADSSLFVWKLLKDRTPLLPYDKSVFLNQLDGHTDAIWDLKVHPLNPILASCSADGTVRIWDTQVSRPTENRVLRTGFTPTTVSFVTSDPNRLLVSTCEGRILVIDIETAQIISSNITQESVPVNRVVAHPTMPLAISVHDDGSLLFSDWSSGTVMHQIRSAHSTAVAAVDVSPSGLVVATGGHDCSLRVWDIGMKSCIHETTGHRQRRDEGLWSVRFAGLTTGTLVDLDVTASTVLTSAGSDGIIKVYNG